MFEFLKKKKKPVIVTIHGFGKKLSHEFDPLAAYFKERNYEVIQFDLYDVEDENDTDYKVWIQKAEDKMKEVYQTHTEVILIGFSMGGVIASYLANFFPVKQLILCAPAFQYLDFEKVINHGLNAIKKKESSNPGAKFVKAFSEIVSNYKTSIDLITCPLLLMHGTDDEVIPLESSRKAYQKADGKKVLIFIEGGKHRMLYDGTHEKTCFCIIEQMIEGNLL